MNIAVDTQYSASVPVNTEPTTITYKPAAQGTGNVSRSGCTLDIADKVMDNEAYGGHGMTAEDIMQQAANSNAQSKKDFMIVMSSCVSGEDLQKMQEEGFNPGSVDVETYVTIVDRIKVTLAKAGVEVAGYNDNLDLDTIEQIVGGRANASTLVNELVGKLSDALQESDMPVTNENIAELVSAVMEASGIGELSEDAIKYLIVNGKSPTIENIYKAQYSSAENIRQSQGYYSEGQGNYGKYYAKKADSINWKNLEGRIESVVKEAGLDTDAAAKAQAVENAKWLVASGMELNADNLIKVTELKNLQLPMNQEELAELCVTAMENGKSPAEADMRGERSVAELAHEIAEQVEKISDEAVCEVADSGKEMNIRNLAEAQKQIDEQQTSASREGVINVNRTEADDTNVNAADTANAENETALKELQARRQLEEIRLMMTEEANRHLLKAGISIDTTELSKLVDALKAAEDSIRAILFQGESTEENTERALLYEDTLTKTKELSEMPAAVIGRILSKVSQSTLLHIHEAGKELQNKFDNQQSDHQNPNQRGKASAAYETLMTEPRKDLGDRISKAFRNIDDILTDLGLEKSEANQRAVRILGYNRMAVNEDNINAVKAADSQVTGVISRMTPAATLQMIRDQKNPLEMTMEELERYLDSKDMDPTADTEKYSRFLQRLDHTGGINAEEREAYIGIYRMFRQIEKSDGAVIGSLVATGAQMNFKNMLSAVRTAADKNMDVRVDDGFGGLEELITKGKAIDAQINAGYHNSANNESSRQNADEDTQAQEKYYARLSGEINDELAGKTDFSQLKSSEITAETTIEEFADTVKAVRVSENSAQAKQEKADNLKSFRDDMHEVEQIDEQIIESLIAYGQHINMDNVQAASTLIFERGSMFRQIIHGNTADTDDTDVTDTTDSEAAESEVLRQADSFIENLTDTKQAGVSYQEIISEANKAVEQMIYAGAYANAKIDVKAAKALYKGLSLAGNLAREENYEIPMNIKGEITSVNLKIYHNASQAGKVAVTLDTENLGKVAAEFDVTQDRISGMIVYEHSAQKTELARLEDAVKQEFGKTGDKKASISLVHTKSVDLNKFGQDRDTRIKADSAKIPTSELYQVSKAFLTALKDM